MAPRTEGTFDFRGEPVDFRRGDDLLTALLRSGTHPTPGGCLCCAGDCPHCLVSVDGVAYVRACQTPARADLAVDAHPATGAPPLPEAAAATEVGVSVRNVHSDVVVVGSGESGTTSAAALRSEGRVVEVFDAGDGQEVVGLYAGPTVVARTDAGMVHAHCEEVVIATGAAELQPVCPGDDLQGILTARAAEHLEEAGVDLGTVIAVGTPPVGVVATHVEGTLVRFEGDRRVAAVVVAADDGIEQRHSCDTAVVGLGLAPRDALARMGHGLAVRVVGDASLDPDLPACPTAGSVCPCSGVSLDDLQASWDRGFHEIELLKRSSLAGTGTCQGSVCMPYLRSFLLDRGGELQPSFTARPVTRQMTMGEIAAGQHHHVFLRTALDGEHRRLGAQMDPIGGWWRPWTYGDTDREYHAVRHAVSMGDVSTLGKMILSGPDAEAALQKLFPTDIATIRPGRARYILMLDERGYVLDDGMVCREPDGERFYLTFTSGGANVAEMWVRDWTSELDVLWMNVTTSLGAVNVTGPSSRELLARAGLVDDVPFLAHTEVGVAGVPCRVVRLSFTGEESYELHHPFDRSVELWRALLELGTDLGMCPHGIDVLTRLRLEKGHVVVGQDTDYDTTPRRLAHEWAVHMDKGDFIGRHALTRTDRVPLDRRLVGLETAGPPPFEGAVVWQGNTYAGYVTSSAWSPVLGRSVMLAWLYYIDGELPHEVSIDGQIANRASVPFYDPEGARARA